MRWASASSAGEGFVIQRDAYLLLGVFRVLLDADLVEADLAVLVGAFRAAVAALPVARGAVLGSIGIDTMMYGCVM